MMHFKSWLKIDEHRRRFSTLTAGLLIWTASIQAEETNHLLFSERFERDLTGRWEQLKFGRPTDHFIFRDGATHCLKAVADKTCSALMTKVDIESPCTM